MRYIFLALTNQSQPPWTYLTTYKLEPDGLQGLPVPLADAAKKAGLTAPPPGVMSGQVAWVYTAISDYLLDPGGACQ